LAVMIDREDLTEAIDRVLSRYASWGESGSSVPSIWELADRALCWHVVLHGALEPDIDVEVRGDALVVRAAVETSMVQAVLAVPRPYDPRLATVHFRAGVLQVRVEFGA